jgi:hypothetical protein
MIPSASSSSLGTRRGVTGSKAWAALQNHVNEINNDSNHLRNLLLNTERYESMHSHTHSLSLAHL